MWGTTTNTCLQVQSNLYIRNVLEVLADGHIMVLPSAVDFDVGDLGGLHLVQIIKCTRYIDQWWGRLALSSNYSIPLCKNLLQAFVDVFSFAIVKNVNKVAQKIF